MTGVQTCALPIYYPYLIDKKGIHHYLQINYLEKKNFIITEDPQYLIFRPNKKYRLYYWDREWIFHEEKIANNEKTMSFNSLPSNTVYILIPEYSNGKERPFTLDKDLSIIRW